LAGEHSASASALMMSDTLSDSRRLPKSAKISTFLGGNLRTNKAVFLQEWAPDRESYLGYYIYNRTQEQQNKTNVVKIVLFIIENV
jgi:hypothetical protein